MKTEGVKKQATVRIWFRTVAIDVCLMFNVAVVFSSTEIVCKAQLIGGWLENRRGALNCLVLLFFLLLLFCQPIGDVKPLVRQ